FFMANSPLLQPNLRLHVHRPNGSTEMRRALRSARCQMRMRLSRGSFRFCLTRGRVHSTVHDFEVLCTFCSHSLRCWRSVSSPCTYFKWVRSRNIMIMTTVTNKAEHHGVMCHGLQLLPITTAFMVLL